MKSFNEKVEIHFDEVEHIYTYKKKRMRSATGFVSSYEEPFDRERIGHNFSQKHNVDFHDLLAMWDTNGNIAAGFGTAIHAVLEYYYTYKDLGETIQDSAGREHNAAMPNHPFLRQLILDLEEILTPGEAHQEALISLVDKGICGLVDNLLLVNKNKKICRIRDYKITYDILAPKNKLPQPFSYLGDTKLSKNFLQLSFYAYMMQATGWKVEGIDILNWDGSWSIHSLNDTDLMKTMLLIGNEI